MEVIRQNIATILSALAVGIAAVSCWITYRRYRHDTKPTTADIRVSIQATDGLWKTAAGIESDGTAHYSGRVYVAAGSCTLIAAQFLLSGGGPTKVFPAFIDGASEQFGDKKIIILGKGHGMILMPNWPTHFNESLGTYNYLQLFVRDMSGKSYQSDRFSIHDE